MVGDLAVVTHSRHKLKELMVRDHVLVHLFAMAANEKARFVLGHTTRVRFYGEEE